MLTHRLTSRHPKMILTNYKIDVHQFPGSWWVRTGQLAGGWRIISDAVLSAPRGRVPIALTTSACPRAAIEGFCRYQGRSVDLATFAGDTLQRNREGIATQFTPLIKDGPGWAAVQG